MHQVVHLHSVLHESRFGCSNLHTLITSTQNALHCSSYSNLSPPNAYTQQPNCHILHAFAAERTDVKGPRNRSSRKLHGKQGSILLSKVDLHDLDYYCYPGRSNNRHTSPRNCCIEQDCESQRQAGGNSCPEDTLDLAPGTLGVTALHIQCKDALSLQRYITKGLSA